ncbi:hypothetical protein [Kangiella sp.]|uniref:hypothetical protein n=1 Tax=Kangiella sp. TaxID=1920245 RepID=UPI003A943A66
MSNQEDKESIQAITDKLISDIRIVREDNEREARKRIDMYKRMPESFVGHTKEYFVMDTWNVHDQAIPLLLGIHPNNWPHIKSKINYQSLNKLIDSDKYESLKLINPDARKNKWVIRVKDFVSWVNAKGIKQAKGFELAVNNVLGMLNPKGEEKTHSKPQRAKKYSQDREVLFKAVIAVLSNMHEDCIKGGKVSASKVASIVEQKSLIWWPDGEIPFSIETMARHIREAVNTLKR